MVANERTELIACSGHRRRDCVHVPDETLNPAIYRRSGHSHPCQAWRNYSTKSSCRLDRASGTGLVRRYSDLQLDGLAETAIWRCHRINGENRVLGLDAEAIRRVVAASNFQASRAVGFLVGFNFNLLARRS